LTKCWRTGPRKERRERRRRRRRGRREVKKRDQATRIRNEKDLGREENESDLDLVIEAGEIGAEGGGTEVERVEEVGEIEVVRRREIGAETETGEEGMIVIGIEGIDLEKGGAAGVEMEADDDEVPLVAVDLHEHLSQPRL